MVVHRFIGGLYFKPQPIPHTHVHIAERGESRVRSTSVINRVEAKCLNLLLIIVAGTYCRIVSMMLVKECRFAGVQPDEISS